MSKRGADLIALAVLAALVDKLWRATDATMDAAFHHVSMPKTTTARAARDPTARKHSVA